MRIENILQIITAQFFQRKGVKSSSKPLNSTEDKVEISSEARDLQKNHKINDLQNGEVKNIQAVREEKVKEVISKVDQDFYSSPKVISKIGESLLKLFGI
ncbi:MAG: flagellar biosynthesis anti-sigma factor FlgM [Candidatus Helarchaeota archaeon]|nr:flagellar biosynthesis anti-sigma factor FlgM [Candidatus Helarchaeota archaeon]